MSILIKGMKMPKDGKVVLIDPWGNLIETQAVELPPHGRLIDADAIPFVESEEGCLDDYAYRYDINEMPTIIPAEGGENI